MDSPIVFKAQNFTFRFTTPLRHIQISEITLRCIQTIDVISRVSAETSNWQKYKTSSQQLDI